MKKWEWNLLEDKAAVEQIEIRGVVLRVGDRVRLNPKEGGDILDIALRGQLATIESLEEDYEGTQHVCVVLEDDPGRDLGMMRQPGHRFFFTPAEVEPELRDEAGRSEESVKPRAERAKILVAGIGNIFLGDDAFGVEVVRRLLQRNPSNAVRVVDFGVRGLDLVYALQDGYETAILIDAFPHGQAPGTVSVVKPDTENLIAGANDFVEPHGMHPLNVLQMASAMNVFLKRVFLIGCEPASFGGDEGHMGLSAEVESAVDEGVKATEALIQRILSGEGI